MVDEWKEGLQPNQRAVLDRFLEACRQDDRIIAAFIAGSYAKGTFDEFSDLDLFLITRDDDCDDFCTQRHQFIRLLGEPLSLENFETPNVTCFVFDNGVEGDLVIHREGQLEMFLIGPYQVLLDKGDLLKGAVFHEHRPETMEQAEKLRRLVFWFWHDWMHFTTALGRGQLWWAQGQLEALRGYCVSLLRLQDNFYDDEAGREHYFKIEEAVPVDQLSRLKSSFGPLDKDLLRKAGLLILQVYKGLAPDLAQKHGLQYPDKLEEVLMRRWEETIH